MSVELRALQEHINCRHNGSYSGSYNDEDLQVGAIHPNTTSEEGKGHLDLARPVQHFYPLGLHGQSMGVPHHLFHVILRIYADIKPGGTHSFYPTRQFVQGRSQYHCRGHVCIPEVGQEPSESGPKPCDILTHNVV